MNQAEKAYNELKKVDELADGDSVVHRFSPIAKLLVTIIYILTVMSFPKYALDRLLVMFIYPYMMYQLAGISMRQSLHRLRYILPLLLFVGIFNPIFDQSPMLQIGSIVVSGGWISFLVLCCKGVFVLLASYLLVVTTKMDAICYAMRRLHVPSIFVSLFLLTYRYIFAMMEEVSIMADAYRLRAPSHKGIEYRAWGSFLGQLLLRSMDQAKDIYQAMYLRGYHGEYFIDTKKTQPSYVYGFGWISIILFLRFVPVVEWIGNLFV